MAMTGSAQSSSATQNMRINEEQLGQILDRLDLADYGGLGSQSEPAHPYQGKYSLVTIDHGDGTQQSFRSPLRHIRSDGVRIVHGSFVYTGTPCAMQLITRHGAWTDVMGKVVGCHHLIKHLHVITIAFDEPIDISLYSRVVQNPRILLVDDNAFVTKVAFNHLTELSGEVDQAENGRQAVLMATKQPYDLILMDIQMPEMDGFEATTILRSKGYTGMIVAATALTQPQDRQRCFEVGCDRYIPKPYSKETLAQLISDLQVEPLCSSLSQEPGMTELINAFVGSLLTRMQSVFELVHTGDREALIATFRELKAEGGMHGFEPISDRAATIEATLLTDTPLSEIREQLQDLNMLCRSARPALKVVPTRPKSITAIGAA